MWCDTDFPSEHIYDTSTLQNEEKLYYFKRINKKWQGTKDASRGDEMYSYLRLFKFDFSSRKESMVINTQEFVVNELLYSPEGEEADIACYNITFADKFGHEKKKDNKKMKELEFLRQQQIIIQEYIHEPKEKKSWQIFCLCDLKKPIFTMKSDDQKTQ